MLLRWLIISFSLSIGSSLFNSIKNDPLQANLRDRVRTKSDENQWNENVHNLDDMFHDHEETIKKDNHTNPSYKLNKRDVITKDNDNWCEAFNMTDWWDCLKSKIKKADRSEKSADKSNIRNDIKRVCFNDILDQQLLNGSFFSAVHFNTSFSDFLGNINQKSSRSTAKQTEPLLSQMIDLRTPLTTENLNESLSTDISVRKSRNKSFKSFPFFSSIDFETKNKSTNRNLTAEVKENVSQRIILRFKDDRKGSNFSKESKTGKPLGNFLIEFQQERTTLSSIALNKTETALIIKNESIPRHSLSKVVSTTTINSNILSSIIEIKPPLAIIQNNSNNKFHGNIRKTRSLLYPSPMNSRQFHLMHGLYSGNKALMEGALRNAELQALYVASDLHRTSKSKHASFFENIESGLKNHQIFPILNLDGENKNNPAKRKIDSPNELDSSLDSQIQERVNYLNDLNYAITKRREELQNLERLFQNNQVGVPIQYFVDSDIRSNENDIGPLMKKVENLPYSFQDRMNQLDISPNNFNKPNSILPLQYSNISSLDLFNNPYLESMLKIYANNYLTPNANQPNATLLNRTKREISDCYSENPINGTSQQVLPIIDKEDLLKSLRELEELEKALIFDYEKSYCLDGERNNGKRWLLPTKKDKPISSFYKPCNDLNSIFTPEKKIDPEPFSELVSKNTSSSPTTPEIIKKISNLETDLIDLKNSLTNLYQREPNKDNAVFVHVNVSLALFNGSSPTNESPAEEVVSKKRSHSTPIKYPNLTTSVSIRKLNASSFPELNLKSQKSLCKKPLNELDKKREITKSSKPNNEVCQFNLEKSKKQIVKNYDKFYQNVRYQEISRDEAVKNLQRQFESIDKILTDEVKKNKSSLKTDEHDKKSNSEDLFSYFDKFNCDKCKEALENYLKRVKKNTKKVDYINRQGKFLKENWTIRDEETNKTTFLCNNESMTTIPNNLNSVQSNERIVEENKANFNASLKGINHIVKDTSLKPKNNNRVAGGHNEYLFVRNMPEYSNLIDSSFQNNLYEKLHNLLQNNKFCIKPQSKDVLLSNTKTKLDDKEGRARSNYKRSNCLKDSNWQTSNDRGSIFPEKCLKRKSYGEPDTCYSPNQSEQWPKKIGNKNLLLFKKCTDNTKSEDDLTYSVAKRSVNHLENNSFYNFNINKTKFNNNLSDWSEKSIDGTSFDFVLKPKSYENLKKNNKKLYTVGSSSSKSENLMTEKNIMKVIEMNNSIKSAIKNENSSSLFHQPQDNFIQTIKKVEKNNLKKLINKYHNKSNSRYGNTNELYSVTIIGSLKNKIRTVSSPTPFISEKFDVKFNNNDKNINKSHIIDSENTKKCIRQHKQQCDNSKKYRDISLPEKPKYKKMARRSKLHKNKETVGRAKCFVSCKDNFDDNIRNTPYGAEKLNGKTKVKGVKNKFKSGKHKYIEDRKKFREHSAILKPNKKFNFDIVETVTSPEIDLLFYDSEEDYDDEYPSEDSMDKNENEYATIPSSKNKNLGFIDIITEHPLDTFKQKIKTRNRNKTRTEQFNYGKKNYKEDPHIDIRDMVIPTTDTSKQNECISFQTFTVRIGSKSSEKLEKSIPGNDQYQSDNEICKIREFTKKFRTLIKLMRDSLQKRRLHDELYAYNNLERKKFKNRKFKMNEENNCYKK